MHSSYTYVVVVVECTATTRSAKKKKQQRRTRAGTLAYKNTTVSCQSSRGEEPNKYVNAIRYTVVPAAAVG